MRKVDVLDKQIAHEEGVTYHGNLINENILILWIIMTKSGTRRGVKNPRVHGPQQNVCKYIFTLLLFNLSL